MFATIYSVISVSILLYISVTIERVIGIPFISLIITTAVLASASRFIKFLYFGIATFLLATVYVLPIVVVGICLLFAQVILYGLKPYVKQFGSTLFYVSFGAAVILANISGILWSTQVLLVGVVQFILALYLVRVLVFTEQQTQIQWKKELFSGKVVEKTI